MIEVARVGWGMQPGKGRLSMTAVKTFIAARRRLEMECSADKTLPIAYWIAFGPHGPRAQAPPGEGTKVFVYTILGVVAAGALFGFTRYFAGPPPRTMNKEWQEATDEYMKVSMPYPSQLLPVCRSSAPLGQRPIHKHAHEHPTDTLYHRRRTRSNQSALSATSKAVQRPRSKAPRLHQSGHRRRCCILNSCRAVIASSTHVPFVRRTSNFFAFDCRPGEGKREGRRGRPVTYTFRAAFCQCIKERSWQEKSKLNIECELFIFQLSSTICRLSLTQACRGTFYGNEERCPCGSSPRLLPSGKRTA